MKNITKILVISMILMPFWAHAESSTPAPSPATVSVASVAPASTGTSASAAPASSESVVTTAPVSAPANTGSSASVAPESTGTVTSSAPAATVTSTSVGSYTPSNEGSNGGSSGGSTGGSSSGSSSSGSSSSGGSYIGFYGCPMITTYMKFGANNNTIEVTKLQNFLKNIEKLDVDVNGIFDRKTEKAVIAFQNKYSSTIMGPWSTNQGTGFVYITTQKQINKIACNLPLTLNANELAIINNSKTAKSATKSEVIITPKNEAEVIMTEVKINETQAISTSTDTNEDQTASVSKPSIMKRFVNFIIYLFK